MECGWPWTIPQRDDDDVGYGYSSCYCDDEHLRRVLEAKLLGVELATTLVGRLGGQHLCWRARRATA